MAALDHFLGLLTVIALLSTFPCACEAGVVPENIIVTGTGLTKVDGTYVRAEDYNQHPQWKKGDGSDRVVYFGSNQYWMFGDLAGRAENMCWVAAHTQGATTPMQVPSWDKYRWAPSEYNWVNFEWKTEGSVSVSVSQGDLLKAYDALQSQESQLEKAQRELEAKDKVLLQAQRELEAKDEVLLEVRKQLTGNATTLHEAQLELRAKEETLLEAQKQLEGNVATLQKAQRELRAKEETLLEAQKQLEDNAATLQKGAILAIVLVVVFGIPTAALLGPRVARTTKEKETRGKPDNLMLVLEEDDAVLDADFSHVIKDEKVDGKIVRNVRIACRGVDKADVTIKSAFNGSLVEIRRPASPGIPACNWDKLLQFEHSEGCFELKEDHSRLENGVLDLYFWSHEHQQRVFRFPKERLGAGFTNDVLSAAGEGARDDASSSSWHLAPHAEGATASVESAAGGVAWDGALSESQTGLRERATLLRVSDGARSSESS